MSAVGTREQRLESFNIPYSVGNFLNKVFSPAGPGESHVFDMDDRLQDKANSVGSKEWQSDPQTWPG